MGRMISGYTIYRAIDESFTAGIHIVLLTKRRMHFGFGIKITAGFVGQQEMMWSDFRCHWQSLRLGCPNQLDSTRG